MGVGRYLVAAMAVRAVPAETAETGDPGAAPTFETFKQEAERSFLAQQLREHDWNVSETARALKMPRLLVALTRFHD